MVINRRIAISFLTIAAVLTAVVGITLAQFSDEATLTGNTLSTANPNLQIDSEPCSSFSSSTDGIDSSNLYPGESRSENFCLRNNSDGELSMSITGSGHVNSGSLDPSLVTVTVNCGIGEIPIPLNDTSSSTIVNISPNGGVANCTITQTLSGAATNSASNQSINYTVTFTGTQIGP